MRIIIKKRGTRKRKGKSQSDAADLTLTLTLSEMAEVQQKDFATT